MIKYKHDCEVRDIERQLILQSEYDPNCKVIAIIPSYFKIIHDCSLADSMRTTHVHIIWDSK